MALLGKSGVKRYFKCLSFSASVRISSVKSRYEPKHGMTEGCYPTIPQRARFVIPRNEESLACKKKRFLVPRNDTLVQRSRKSCPEGRGIRKLPSEPQILSRSGSEKIPPRATFRGGARRAMIYVSGQSYRDKIWLSSNYGVRQGLALLGGNISLLR